MLIDRLQASVVISAAAVVSYLGATVSSWWALALLPVLVLAGVSMGMRRWWNQNWNHAAQ